MPKKMRYVWIGEIEKIIKRKSCVVFLAIMITLLVIASVVISINKNQTLHKNMIKENDQMLEEKIEEIDISLKFLNDETNVNLNDYARIKSQKKWYQYAKDHQVILLNGEKSDFYEYLLIQELMTLTTEQLLSKDTVQINEIEKNITRLLQILESKNFDAYLDYAIEAINDEENLEVKEVYLQYYSLVRKYFIGSKNDATNAYHSQLAKEILAANLNLLEDNGQMSEKEKELLKETILLNQHYLQENITMNHGLDNIVNHKELFFDICEIIILITLLIFVVAMVGETISGEFMNGTIKETILLPIQKWKVLVCKILAIITISFCILMIGFCIVHLLGAILDSQVASNGYFYVSHGNVCQIPAVFYHLARYLLYFVEIMIYMCIALVITLLTKNAGISTSMTLFLAIGSSTIMAFIVKSFKNAAFLKYIPFCNFELLHQIFPNQMNSIENMLYQNGIMQIHQSLSFAVIYNVIFILLMLAMAFGIWNQKDMIRRGDPS